MNWVGILEYTLPTLIFCSRQTTLQRPAPIREQCHNVMPNEIVCIHTGLIRGYLGADLP